LGGADGGVNTVAIDRKGAIYRPLHLSKDQDIQLEPGDVIRVSTPGGGGYGNAYRRDPNKVAVDVSRGYYTSAQAEQRFGVRLTSDGTVDLPATEQLRCQRA
jgi:N-methylhydantoinase B